MFSILASLNSSTTSLFCCQMSHYAFLWNKNKINVPRRSYNAPHYKQLGVKVLWMTNYENEDLLAKSTLSFILWNNEICLYSSSRRQKEHTHWEATVPNASFKIIYTKEDHNMKKNTSRLLQQTNIYVNPNFYIF